VYSGLAEVVVRGGSVQFMQGGNGMFVYVRGFWYSLALLYAWISAPSRSAFREEEEEEEEDIQ
jgi:hypothetical protein